MKTNTAIRKVRLWLVAVLLLGRLTPVITWAAAPALQGQVTLRPLTPQEIKDYDLKDVQRASGLSTIGLGQPAYLEALVNSAVTNADITSVTWALSSKPLGSSAALVDSPLGTNVPTFKMADRINQAGAPVFKLAGRTLLRPDVRGQYTVTASIQTASSGSTNLSQNITAGTYVGVNTCALCHSGGLVAPNTFVPWSATLHATIFTRGITGHEGLDYGPDSLPFNTVGFDTNAVNGGFDDIARQVGWTFPTTLDTNNWNAVPAPLKNLANIQCESCHGPGSEHAFALGDTNLISKSFIAGNCAQCHDNKSGDPDVGTKFAEWNNSLHSHSTRVPSGPGRENCVRCHTAPGFRNFDTFAGSNTPYVTNTVYEAITCAACHDPHDASNPHQLRAANTFTLPEGTTVTNVGFGALCMTCHHSRNGEANQNIANYQLGKPTWAGGSSFGVHDSTAGDMVEGVNGITYGKAIPSGSHSSVIPNVCAGCHMQPVAPDHPAFTKAGGHTFSMSYSVVTNGLTKSVDLVDVCIKCHGPIKDFNFARKDYDGDGVIDGVQTEVQHLLDKLSRFLPDGTYRADGNYIPDGLVKSSVSVKTNWPTKFLQAAWNWQFVNVEGSRGVHNAPYAVGVLKASIADLTGDANNDGLLDSWQIQYFGSTTDPKAGPNASPAGDGVPNWVKFSLGLDPTKPGITVPGGVVLINGDKVPDSASETLEIYTAAEVVFDTVAGTSYQIQGISNLGAGWQNIGNPIPGTGSSVSYLTPTRTDLKQFFRVAHTP